MLEPGLDRHEWETEWAVHEPLLEDGPADTLLEVDELVARMLTARGYALDDPIAREGDKREVVAEYLAAKEVADAARRGESVDPGAVARGARVGRTGETPHIRHARDTEPHARRR